MRETVSSYTEFPQGSSTRKINRRYIMDRERYHFASDIQPCSATSLQVTGTFFFGPDLRCRVFRGFAGSGEVHFRRPSSF
eukprot:2433989-Pyramimonas_sp.AAC.1